ncbi:MAG: Transcriptional regulatory protein FixJ [Candidatus Accumulibacter sp. BA-94]|nr:MAG: Transcriptional regulatory protein FixJ [Candidatus Accumulibacter sp. BA-94]
MGGMSGPELFDVLCERGCRMPVIFLTGHGDVPMAVAALKKGAFDFVEKPFNDNELVDRVVEALKLDANQRLAAADADSLSARLGSLTTREREVMELVLAGKLNKLIADELQISMRTVEVHRANLFDTPICSTRWACAPPSSWRNCSPASADDDGPRGGSQPGLQFNGRGNAACVSRLRRPAPPGNRGCRRPRAASPGSFRRAPV